MFLSNRYAGADQCSPTPNPCYKTHNPLIVVYLINARSLVNKMDLLRCYLNDFRPAIVCITETWAHNDLPDSFFFVEDYVFYRCDRSKGTGGGVIIYVSNSLSSTFVGKFDDGKASVATCLVSSYDGESLYISCIYIPPGYSLDNCLVIKHLYDVASYNNDFQIFCGDFNRPDIDWNIFKGFSSATSILDWCMDNYLTQKVLIPTRPQSNSVLDLVFTTDEARVICLSVNECFGNSDHAIVSFSVNFIPTHRRVSRLSEFQFSKGNWKYFQKCLYNSSWPSVANDSDVNGLWGQFLHNILRAARHAIPMKPK